MVWYDMISRNTLHAKHAWRTRSSLHWNQTRREDYFYIFLWFFPCFPVSGSRNENMWKINYMFILKCNLASASSIKWRVQIVSLVSLLMVSNEKLWNTFNIKVWLLTCTPCILIIVADVKMTTFFRTLPAKYRCEVRVRWTFFWVRLT